MPRGLLWRERRDPEPLVRIPESKAADSTLMGHLQREVVMAPVDHLMRGDSEGWSLDRVVFERDFNSHTCDL